MALKHYNAKEITINFATLDLNQGAGPDEFITVEEEEDYFDVTVGVDGEVTRNEMVQNTMKVVITLMASSDTNDKLSAIHEADRITPGGAGVAPFLYRNRLGTDKLVSAEAFIMRRPQRARAKKVGVLQWPFMVTYPANFSGS